jgi:hypothetical protein
MHFSSIKSISPIFLVILDEIENSRLSTHPITAEVKQLGERADFNALSV